jgi:hypothetical protein
VSLHPLEDHEIKIEMGISGEMARTLLEHCERRSRAPVELMCDLVQMILSENLIDAILDDVE